MSDTHSLRSFQYDDYPNFPGERHSDRLPPVPPSQQGPNTNPQIPARKQPTADQGTPRAPKTEQLLNTSGPLHDVSTTQSLISALQATMTPSGAMKRPVVIPGNKKRASSSDRNTSAMSVGSIQAVQAAKNRPLPARGLPSYVRLIIVLIIIAIILLISLLSLTPLGKGQSGSPFIGGVIQWAQFQQQGLNIALGQMDGNTNQNQANTQGAPVAPAANPPAVNLPKSQYVDIARQAAISAGIPADYFVRQINQESGFNPGAISPAGAVGIAQFLPSTAAGLGINPYDPVQALNGAARYMARLYFQYNSDYAKALAAYNAGTGTVQNAINLGGANWMNFLPAETRNYIRVIMGI